MRYIFALLFSLLAGPALAANNQGFIFQQYNTSIASTTGSICGPATTSATYAVIQVVGATGYYNFGGANPSSTNGFTLSALQQLPLYGQSLIGSFQIIGAGATINVICTQ